MSMNLTPISFHSTISTSAGVDRRAGLFRNHRYSMLQRIREFCTFLFHPAGNHMFHFGIGTQISCISS
jgi:hypothetical protein